MRFLSDRGFLSRRRAVPKFRASSALAVLAALLSGGCSTLGLGRPPADLRGMVYGFDNAPVASYSLSLDGKREVETDVTGRFSFRDAGIGTHRLSGFREGYESHDSTIVIASRTDIAYLRVASADDLLGLADAALSGGDLQSAGAFVSRAEQTGSRSPLIPFYAAIVLFREGRAGECAGLLDELGRRGFRDPSAARLKDAALAASAGAP